MTEGEYRQRARAEIVMMLSRLSLYLEVILRF